MLSLPLVWLSLTRFAGYTIHSFTIKCRLRTKSLLQFCIKFWAAVNILIENVGPSQTRTSMARIIKTIIYVWVPLRHFCLKVKLPDMHVYHFVIHKIDINFYNFFKWPHFSVFWVALSIMIIIWYWSKHVKYNADSIGNSDFNDSFYTKFMSFPRTKIVPQAYTNGFNKIRFSIALKAISIGKNCIWQSLGFLIKGFPYTLGLPSKSSC